MSLKIIIDEFRWNNQLQVKDKYNYIDKNLIVFINLEWLIKVHQQISVYGLLNNNLVKIIGIESIQQQNLLINDNQKIQFQISEDQQQEIKILEELQINDFVQESLYNYLPKFKRASKIWLDCVNNDENRFENLISLNSLRNLVKYPFVGRVGQCFRVYLNDEIIDCNHHQQTFHNQSANFQSLSTTFHQSHSINQQNYILFQITQFQTHPHQNHTQLSQDYHIYSQHFLVHFNQCEIQINYSNSIVQQQEQQQHLNIFNFVMKIQNIADQYLKLQNIIKNMDKKLIYFRGKKGYFKKQILKFLTNKDQIFLKYFDAEQFVSLQILNQKILSYMKEIGNKKQSHLIVISNISHFEFLINNGSSFKSYFTNIQSIINSNLGNFQLNLLLIDNYQLEPQLSQQITLISNYSFSLTPLSVIDFQSLYYQLTNSNTSLKIYSLSQLYKHYQLWHQQSILKNKTQHINNKNHNTNKNNDNNNNDNDDDEKDDNNSNDNNNDEKDDNKNNDNNNNDNDDDFKEVGGLGEAKEEIKKTINICRNFPSIFNKLIEPRNGILMYGPPGCGKTLLAKSIAQELGMEFISIKGPELLNMYIGESEKNIREVFRQGKEKRPCVIFMDEFDSLVPCRKESNDSNNVMDRVVSQLVKELDSMNEQCNVYERVYLLAATNRPDMIDQSLLRSGRLATLVYLGVQQSPIDRRAILNVLLNHIPHHNLQDHPQSLIHSLEPLVPSTYTGADWQAMIQYALLQAADTHIQSIKHLNRTQQTNTTFIIHHHHFIQAIQMTQPSLSISDLSYYHQLNLKYSSN